MPTKRLWWRIGKGPWHEDPLCIDGGNEPLPQASVNLVVGGGLYLRTMCDRDHDQASCAGDTGVKTRRSSPPVAEQCKRCRAAKTRRKTP